MMNSSETVIPLNQYGHPNMYACAPEAPSAPAQAPQQTFTLEELKKFQNFIQSVTQTQELLDHQQQIPAGGIYPDPNNGEHLPVVKRCGGFAKCLSSAWKTASFYTKKAVRFLSENTSLLYFPIAGYLCDKALRTRMPDARPKYLNIGYGASLLTFIASPLFFDDHHPVSKKQQAKQDEQAVAKCENKNFNNLLLLMCHGVLSKFNFPWCQFDYGRVCFNVPIAMMFALYGVQTALSTRTLLSSSFKWIREVSADEQAEDSKQQPSQDDQEEH